MSAMGLLRFCAVSAVVVAGLAPAARATAPRLDADTCRDMRLEQMKFVETGVLADLALGPEWAKANFSPEKLREIELYIMLDEQLKFGCRDAKISPDAARAGEAAIEIETPVAPPAGANATSKPSPGNESGANLGAAPDASEQPTAKPAKKRKPTASAENGGEKPKRSKASGAGAASAKPPTANGDASSSP